MEAGAEQPWQPRAFLAPLPPPDHTIGGGLETPDACARVHGRNSVCLSVCTVDTGFMAVDLECHQKCTSTTAPKVDLY